MPITKTFNNTSYSIPLEGELNWATLSSFLVALADYSQTINKQKVGMRVAIATPITVLATTDCVIVTDLTTPGAVAVNLPAGVSGQVFTVVDGKGDAGTNNITITPAAGTINGAATYVIDSNRAGVSLAYNGTSWTVIAEFISAGDIPRNQIASGSANHVVINDGSGDLSSEATLATTRGGFGEDVSAYNGVVKAVTGNFESGAIVNNDIDAAAAIARTKLASGTADHVLVNNGTGVMSSEAQLPLAKGGTGINASSATDLFNQLDPLTTRGDILKRGTTDSERLAVGASGAFLKSDGTDPLWSAINLDDLNNVTVPTPEDGQALVYDANSSAWVSGASGDSSFKLQGVTDPNLTLKGGYLLLDDGREIATYDGAGTAATDFGTDIVVNLDTVLGTNPVNATTYYLYLNLLTLGSEVTIDNGRKVYSVAAADTSKFYLSTTKPEAINRAQYAVIGFVKSATTGTVWSGSGAAFGTVASKKHDNGPVAVNPVVYTLPKQAVGSVGSSGQVVAGHVLAADSFPSGISTANTSFYGLAAGSGTDGYGGRNLTPTGATTSTGILAIAGEASALSGSSQYFSYSADSFFNAGNTDFTYGGWYAATDWTPATIGMLASKQGSGTDRSWAIYSHSNGNIFFDIPITATTTDGISVSNSFVDGSFHHFAISYRASDTLWRFYVDGVLVGSLVRTNITTSSNIFRIGSYFDTPALFFNGKVDECFYSKLSFTDEDIRKIYASKITHNANTPTAYQEWTANVYSSVATQDDQSWLVDKTSSNNLYVDFSGLNSTASVELAMKNTGLTPVIVSPVPPFDQTYTSNPTFPITHGQPVVPEVMLMQEVASGSWETITAEGLVASNATTLTGTVAALFTNGATKVRIIAKSPQNDATGVKQAEANSYGIVKGGKVPGATDGVAIVPGYIGEKISVTFTPTAVSGSYADVSPSLTLTKGVWMIYAAFTMAKTASSTGYCIFKLRDTTTPTDMYTYSWGLQSTVTALFTPHTIAVYVNHSNTRSYVLQAYDPNATGTVTFASNTGGIYGQQEFFAVRIA